MHLPLQGVLVYQRPWGATMAMPVSTKMGVTSSITAPIIVVTQPETRTFVPPFTAGIPVSISTHASSYPQVRARINDRFMSIPNFSREQTYGKPTLIMANFHNNAYAFTNHANPFTPFNSRSPSSSSTFA